MKISYNTETKELNIAVPIKEAKEGGACVTQSHAHTTITLNIGDQRVTLPIEREVVRKMFVDFNSRQKSNRQTAIKPLKWELLSETEKVFRTVITLSGLEVRMHIRPHINGDGWLLTSFDAGYHFRTFDEAKAKAQQIWEDWLKQYLEPVVYEIRVTKKVGDFMNRMGLIEKAEIPKIKISSSK